MSNYALNTARSIGRRLTSTAETTIYEVGEKGYTQAVCLRCTNVTGSAATVTVAWYQASATQTFRLVHQQSIPGNLYADYQLEPIAMDGGDQIRVTAGSANAIDVILTVVEIPGRSG